MSEPSDLIEFNSPQRNQSQQHHVNSTSPNNTMCVSSTKNSNDDSACLLDNTLTSPTLVDLDTSVIAPLKSNAPGSTSAGPNLDVVDVIEVTNDLINVEQEDFWFEFYFLKNYILRLCFRNALNNEINLNLGYVIQRRTRLIKSNS
jgi:hypothetical protein